MNNTLIDNSENLKMVDTLKRCIADEDCKEIKIATGYWDIPGLTLVANELKSFLERDDTSLKLLIGSDPIVKSYLQKEKKIKSSKFPEGFIKTEISKLEVTDEYVDSVKLLQEYCLDEENSSKIKIRIYRTDEDGDAQFLHAKCYIFLTDNANEDAYGIIGSSNFTQKGLEGNAELNYLETNGMVVRYTPQSASSTKKGHNCWFEEKWALSKPWNKVFLEEVLKPSAVGTKAKEEQENLTPYEVYIKYLQTQFGDVADPSVDGILKSYLPQDFKMLQYQLDAVKQCFYIMKQHNGFMLADVVGLGKTVIGVLLIKKFLFETAEYERSPKVLIITPPAIKKAWETMILDFDNGRENKIGDKVTFVTTGSIDTMNDDDDDVTVEYNDYGLIIIDESHNFRNSDTKKYKAVETLIDNITTYTGHQPFVGLLSATPMNNRPNDIRNQIYLFERTPNSSTIIGIPNGRLDLFFSEMNKIYDTHKHTSDNEESKKALQEMSDNIKKNVLDHILVRRTRTDIVKHYPDDSKDLHFPKISGPHKLDYTMDDELARLFADTVNMIAPEKGDNNALQFYRYCAIMYFKDKANTQLYEKKNLTVESISMRLQKIMKILLVKRLESSKAAFKASLKNLRDYTKNMLDMLNHGCVFICTDIDVNKAFADANFQFDIAAKTIREKIAKKGGNNREFTSSDFKDEYKTLLEEDLRKINILYDRWGLNDEDPKLDTFVESLDSVLFNEKTNTSRKLVIFTEAIDTQEAIARKAKKKYRVLKVSADNRDKLNDVIVSNFDANAKKKKDDYDIIITTEVLAEGVNLHRANVILNYDTPWNATRLMQRIGRVNRIGSKEEYVYVYNFFPTNQSNDILHLIQNAYAKLQAFHIMFGEDNKVFTEMEFIPEHKLRDWVDGEESEMGKFIKELHDYQQANPLRYDFIKGVDLKNLGGTVICPNPKLSLVLVHAPAKGLVPIAVGEEVKYISNLEFMSLLKCPENVKFTQPSAQTEHILNAAIRCYNIQVSKSLIAKNESKEMKRAMELVQELKSDNSLSAESISALNQAMKAIRVKNKTVIRALLDFDKERSKGQRSLFGKDFDINSWINGAFAHVVKQNAEEYGKPEIALYSIGQQ